MNKLLVEDLQGYLDHCMNTGQEQVADLVGRGISEITRQDAVIGRLGDEKYFYMGKASEEYKPALEIQALRQYARDNRPPPM